MTKKSNPITKMVLSATLASAMVISMALPAAAARPQWVTGQNAANPAKAAITKLFLMPINTPTPKADFTFVFEPVGVDTNTSDVVKAKMPTIPDRTISFNGDAATKVDQDKGVKYVAKEFEDILQGLGHEDWANSFQDSIYNYKVSEVESGIHMTLDEQMNSAADKEDATYSKAVYDIAVFVDVDENDKYFAKYISAKIVPGDEDEYYEKEDDRPADGKVDSTPGGNSTIDSEDPIISDFSQLIFTNKYWTTNGGGTGDISKSGALQITKEVVNGAGSWETDEFSFDVMVKQPSIIKDAQKYKAYIKDKNNANVTTQANAGNGNVSRENGGNFITFPSGSYINGIKLTHGQKLVFVDLHVGSDVEAKEGGDSNYRPSYQRSFAGTQLYKGAAGSEFGFPRNTEDQGSHFTEDAPNTVDFFNRSVGVTPTGIEVDDLPYIVLIGAVIAGLAGFVALKFRKNAKYEA